MSLANEFFVLFGKNVTRDARGLNARLHFFGSIPVEDGSPVSSTREDVPSMNVRAARPPWWLWSPSMAAWVAALWLRP